MLVPNPSTAWSSVLSFMLCFLLLPLYCQLSLFHELTGGLGNLVRNIKPCINCQQGNILCLFKHGSPLTQPVQQNHTPAVFKALLPSVCCSGWTFLALLWLHLWQVWRWMMSRILDCRWSDWVSNYCGGFCCSGFVLETLFHFWFADESGVGGFSWSWCGWNPALLWVRAEH